MSDTTIDVFEYTDSFAPDSSFVYGVYYNEDKHTLLVVLNPDDPRFYGYENVPNVTYGAFKDADSAGRFYNNRIVGTYKSMHLDPHDPIFVLSVLPARVQDKISVDDSAADKPVKGPNLSTFRVHYTVEGVRFFTDVEASDLAEAFNNFAAHPERYIKFSVTGVNEI